MNETPNPFLATSATLCALAAALHLACIFFGASWYRFFGAGERMAQLASAGSWHPALVTLAIAVVLGTWSLYALSGAGVVPRLPFLRFALCIITGIFLLRGVAVFPLVALSLSLGRSLSFWWWSSAICFTIGFVQLVGLRQVWASLAAA
jgi:hypothetical protein